MPFRKMKYNHFIRICASLLALAFLQVSLSAAPIPAPSAERMTPTVKAVRKALPWVVSIGTTQQIIQINDPFAIFFTDFFSQPRRVFTKFSPLGSGVIIDPSGLVVTNYHVVRRASDITVQMWDGTSLSAHVLGYDVDNDLCLLQLQGELPELASAEFAATGDLYLGETVIAIGNPFGLGQSVSTGVLSALNRSFQEGDVYFENLIQTDAAINPGNSGGPLVNLDGKLVGINQAIRADAQGIGFAIPLSHIEDFLSYWLKPSHFSDAYMGLMPSGIVAEGNENGVVLPDVLAESPLSKAGIKTGDVVLAVDGKAVNRPLDFGRLVFNKHAGDEIVLTTADGSHAVKLESQSDAMLVGTRLGMELVELTPQLRSAMRLRQEQKGLVLSEVKDEPSFGVQEAQWRQVLRRGDILLQFAGQDYPTLKQVAEALRGSRAGDFCQAVFYFTSVKIPVEVGRLQLN
ncbi:MAG: trypsin-like peptidase domain-containing protein [Lentisphaeria bacterium]|nr:trypsin-like peptidase domain-containing protein [Lentisphaeria bacterium]